MNLQSALNEGSKFLKNRNIPNSKLDSEILMSKIINKDRKFIILNNNYKLSNKSFIDFKEALLNDQRIDSVPPIDLLKKICIANKLKYDENFIYYSGSHLINSH